MLRTVSPRLVNALCRLPCLHLASLSSLQLEKRTSDGVEMSEVRRRKPAGTRTPYFQHFWKPGSGYYGESLGRVTKTATDICEDLSHIDAVPVPSPTGVFTIGDYGTCDGSVSLQLIHKIIEHLRNKHGPSLKIQVLYEDQPSNDYSSLFKTIYGEASYMSKFDNVFTLACGTSFYKQCVPDNSCDIIICSFATHWLSSQSYVTCSNTIFPWRSTSEEEARVHREAAARDWQTFLLLRTAELKRGGLLFVVQPSTNLGSSNVQSDSETIPFKDNAGRRIQETIRDICVNTDLSWNELYTEGLITREEFQSCTLPVAMRSLQEIKAPFEDTIISPVRQAGLVLLQEPEEFVMPCFAKTLWRQRLDTDGVDDRNLFAQLITKAFRVILDSTLKNSLMATRSWEEQSSIMERLYSAFVKRVVLLSPQTFQSEHIVRRLVAQKS